MKVPGPNKLLTKYFYLQEMAFWPFGLLAHLFVFPLVCVSFWHISLCFPWLFSLRLLSKERKTGTLISVWSTGHVGAGPVLSPGTGRADCFSLFSPSSPDSIRSQYFTFDHSSWVVSHTVWVNLLRLGLWHQRVIMQCVNYPVSQGSCKLPKNHDKSSVGLGEGFSMMSKEMIPYPSLHIYHSLVAACGGNIRSLFCFIGLGKSGSCLA